MLLNIEVTKTNVHFQNIKCQWIVFNVIFKIIYTDLPCLNAQNF